MRPTEPVRPEPVAVDAVVFDFDGLIIDSETPIFRASAAALAELGHHLTVEAWATVVGHGEEDSFRALQSALQFHPLEAKAKLAIIDDADRMNASTANSLLKILEEPPPLTHFALVSTMPNSLLPTIRSRSARLDFGPLSDGEIAAKIASERGVAREEALRIARLSGGSLGTALAIDPEFLSDTIGRFLTLCRKASTADVLATAEGWSHRAPGEIRLTFDLLASFYRDCLRIAAAGGEVSAAHPEAFEMAPRIGAARASRALSDIDSARRSFDTTANKQLMFENLLFSLTS